MPGDNKKSNCGKMKHHTELKPLSFDYKRLVLFRNPKYSLVWEKGDEYFVKNSDICEEAE
jgi:hypothetical protein